MADKRKIEIFSAGCAVCQDAVSLVERLACDSCDISVLDMKDPTIADRARKLGIGSVPAVAIDGKLAECCTGRGIDEATLKKAGIGQPL
jgi:hypothetical protein